MDSELVKAELDDLPALQAIAFFEMYVGCGTEPKLPPLFVEHFQTVAESHKRLSSRVKELERENAELRNDKTQLDKACRQHLTRALENGQAAQRAESELAALRKRIAEAPTHVAEWTLAYGLTFNDADGTLDGHRVALLDMGKEG